MLDLSKVYRWCDDFGGGLVIADSIEDARAKLIKIYEDFKRHGKPRNDFIIWEWTNDDYYDNENPDVFDIYS